jgi:hypothetical protein
MRFCAIARWAVKLLAFGLIVAAAFVVCSYSYGLWYTYQTDQEQHAVWAAYLNHALSNAESPSRTNTAQQPIIVVRDHTEQAYRHTILALLWPMMARGDRHMYERLPALRFGTYSRFLLGSLLPHSIRQLNVVASYRLATADEVAAYGETGNRWQRLFPQSAGFFVFSTVGFNAERTEALLHVDYFCGLCGGGSYVLLRKHNGRWAVAEEASTWVS